MKFVTQRLDLRPIDGPDQVFLLCVVDFECVDIFNFGDKSSTNLPGKLQENIYRFLCRGERVVVALNSIYSFTSEEPAMIFSENNLVLQQLRDSEWELFM